ncbi:MAG: ATP-binding protein [Rhodobacteraceae bacterium]|nr:ATP-binding protein [Paracoccaceae bacterium]
MEFVERLTQERRARLAAERILEQKKKEFYAVSIQLSQRAQSLAVQVDEQRHGLERARDEAAQLKGMTLQAQEEMKAALAAAEQAERRLWSALDAFVDGFAIFDSRYRLIVCNRPYADLFGGPGEAAPGVTYDSLMMRLAASGRIELDGLEPQDWYHQMTARIVSPAPEPVAVRRTDGQHLRFVDRRSGNGDLVCLALDMTESVRREAELEEARNRAEAATRAKSAFLANMTHELRTPMNGVVGMAELLCESDLPAEQRAYAETIRASGEALLTIINDVLDLSKAEADRLRLFPEDFDLERCIHDVMLLVQPGAEEKGLALVVDYDPDMPARVIADPVRMRQILTNLVGNAVKFTETGHVVVRAAGLPLPDGRIRTEIEVEDTGIGIAPAMQEHVFGEFNQVESQTNRRFEGTGLGLAITRRLVELMGGRVWVDSEPGRGSVFGVRVDLPAAAEGGAGPWTAPPAIRRVALALPPGPGRDVLVRQLRAAGLTAEVLPAPGAAASAGTDALILDEALADPRPEEGGPPVILLGRGAAEGPAGPAVAAMLRKPLCRSELRRALEDLAAGVAPAAPPADRPGRRMRVLAAEDNKTNQLVLGKMLKDAAIDLVFAADGREAVELWQSFRPDLIFTDISMPVMDGKDAAREIRRREAARGLRPVTIIALTAHAMDGDETEILAAGIDRYLSKPLRKAALLEAIATFCPPGATPPLPAGTAAAEG